MRPFLECSRDEAEPIAEILRANNIPFAFLATHTPLAGGEPGLGGTGFDEERVVILIPAPRHKEAEAVLSDPSRDDDFEDWMQAAFDGG